MKKCSTCGETKSLSGFYKDKAKKDGLKSECKPCAAMLKKEYLRTKKGLVKQLYSNQRNSSRTRRHDLPDYSLQELREWAYSQKIFHELYSAWKSSGYQKALIPSFDRIDNECSYTLSNLQIVTWAENSRLGREYTAKLQSKAVVQLDKKTGEILARFDSTMDAQRLTGIDHTHISAVCRNKVSIKSDGRIQTHQSAGGFKWKFVDADEDHQDVQFTKA